MDIVIVYSSVTGTTQWMAKTIAKLLNDNGRTVEVKEAFETDIEELLKFNTILIGSYTWGEGEIPDEMFDFYEDLKNKNLAGKFGGVFGPGSSVYGHFANAVNLFEERLKKQGCCLLTESLKVDVVTTREDEIEEKCKVFSKNIVQATLSECN